MRVLILGDIAPNSSQTAGAVLSSFVEAMPEDVKVDALVIGDMTLSYDLRQSNADRVFYVPKPWSQWSVVRPKTLAPLLQRQVERFEIPRIASRVQLLINELSPDLVLTAAQCPNLVFLINRLDFRNARHYAFMWDHPSWWADAHGLSGAGKSHFIEQWEHLMLSADKRLVPSLGASAFFEALGSNGGNEVVYPFIASPFHGEFENDKKVVRMVFAGQAYASAELDSVVNLFNSSGWKLSGRDVELHVFGRQTLFQDIPQVHNHGWLPAPQVSAIATTMDFGILPYPSESSMKLVSEMSFPSKLSLYLSAGLPVLFVGPAGTAVGKFIEAEKFGRLAGNSVTLEELSNFACHLSDYAEHAKSAYRDYFSQQAFILSVRDILELDQSHRKVGQVSLRNRVVSFDWTSGVKTYSTRLFKANVPSVSNVLGALFQPLSSARWLISKAVPRRGFKAICRDLYLTLPRIAIGVAHRIASSSEKSAITTARTPPVSSENSRAEFAWTRGRLPRTTEEF